jgi:hypothetical protein
VKRSLHKYEQLRYELWKNIALLNSIVVILEEFHRLSPILQRTSSWRYLDISALTLFDYGVLIVYRIWKPTSKPTSRDDSDLTLGYLRKYIEGSIRRRAEIDYRKELQTRIEKLTKAQDDFSNIFKKLESERNKLVAHLDVHVLLNGKPRNQNQRDKERRRLARQKRDLRYLKQAADFLSDYFLALSIGSSVPRYVYGLDKTKDKDGRLVISPDNIATHVFRQLASEVFEVHLYRRDKGKWEKLYGRVTEAAGGPAPKALIDEVIEHIEKQERRARS